MAMIFRCLAAVIAGMILAFILVIAIELVSAVIHPVPSDFQGTKEEMCLHVQRYPAWVLALVVPAWGGTAFAGTWVSGRIGNRSCTLFVGLLLTAAAVFNVAMLPYPTWFKIAIVVAVPAAVFLGSRLSSICRTTTGG